MSYFFIDSVMDYYRNPRNRGKLSSYDAEYGDSNPTCGDTVKIYIKVKDNALEDISFEGKACALSMASASLLTEMAKGMKIEEAMKITEKDIMDAFMIKELGPNRIKCVALPVKVLKMTIASYVSNKQKG
ncbi:MAG: iron-sulfur cluster assembly scaffold protein [Nitrososphaeria archaeon]